MVSHGETARPGEKKVYPIDENGKKMTWNYEVKTLREKLILSEISAKTDNK